MQSIVPVVFAYPDDDSLISFFQILTSALRTAVAVRASIFAPTPLDHFSVRARAAIFSNLISNPAANHFSHAPAQTTGFAGRGDSASVGPAGVDLTVRSRSATW